MLSGRKSEDFEETGGLVLYHVPYDKLFTPQERPDVNDDADIASDETIAKEVGLSVEQLFSAREIAFQAYLKSFTKEGPPAGGK
jgi:hypothetical protein